MVAFITLVLHRVGEKRRLVIPWQLAYGDKPDEGKVIPTKSAVIFILELTSLVKKAEHLKQVQQKKDDDAEMQRMIKEEQEQEMEARKKRVGDL